MLDYMSCKITITNITTINLVPTQVAAVGRTRVKVLSNGTVAKDNTSPSNQTKWLREKLRHRYAMSMPEESELVSITLCILL